MILNRLIFPEGNKLEFRVEHSENGTPYSLSDGEQYYIIISHSVTPFETVNTFNSAGNNFDCEMNIQAGEYVFEIGISDAKGNSRIILPALDERLRPLNQLLVLRRLEK